MSNLSYISIADILDYWQNTIAPNYLDFDNTNNYKAGLFGYINEVMANTTEDAFNAINIARREFYPITAKNKQTLYKMATTQKIDLPTTTPATCKAFLIIPQTEIISKSTLSNSVYTCVIDNSMIILADEKPFMLDYPIVIISKKVGTNYSHTAHYDLSESNSLSNISSKYIMNLVIASSGVNYLSLAVTLRQVTMESISKLVTKDSNIDIVSLDYTFEGNLANFEVYYSEDNGTTETQLTKLLYGSSALTSAFVYYQMVDDNTIRLIFPKNAYFTPAYNSQVRMEIFTSLGSGGNFDAYSGDLITQISSEKYPYNNTMTITGKTNGSASGGADKKTDTEFQQDIIKAYSTNNTITTSNDLQLYFNDLGATSTNKILFRKKRDDPLYRTFGAYSILKDTSDNVVPTNTLDLNMATSDFDVFTSISDRAILKPGTLYEYEANNGSTITYTIKKVTDLTIVSDLDTYDDNSRFIFTSPFLIAVTFSPNVVGFYLNSISNSYAIEYSYANDETYVQFIGSALTVKRNSVLRVNYYKFTINVTSSTDIDTSLVATKNDSTLEANMIRATLGGIVTSRLYVTDHVITTVTYSDSTTATINTGNYITYDETNGFEYHTGYNMNFEVGDSFVANDILATKCDTDLGKLRLMGDVTGLLTDNDMYFPFVLEAIDTDTGICTYAAYLATTDYMTLDATMLISYGICNKDGTMNANVSIPMNDLSFKISSFYKNDDTNYSHSYSSYNFYKNYTMTNTYTVSDTISLIQQIDYIRSTLTYVEGETEGTYTLSISEIPLVKANWVKSVTNLKYLINIIQSNYTNLSEAYYLLENNFGIDFKFFNTFGKSRFYKVGVKDTLSTLDSVNCSFNFGVSLSTLSSTDVFIEKFRDYVKEYIESLNDIASNGQSIYIMNLIADLKSEFSEIKFIEYYGMNSYGYEVQKIQALTNDELSSSEITSFVPEFINIYSYNDGTNNIPKITVTILD